MRTREEICAAVSKSTETAVSIPQLAINDQRLILEVLLDIRDLLTPPPALPPDPKVLRLLSFLRPR